MHEFVGRRPPKHVEPDSSQGTSQSVPDSVTNVLDSAGHPLDNGTRAAMGPTFGSDFSRVRVHTDTLAARSARAVGAQAYTVGNHIVFDAGRYAPGTTAGDRLLRHELTHVRQQEHAAPTGEILQVGLTDEPAEREAEVVASGGHAHASTMVGPPVLRRQPAETPAAETPEVALGTRFNAALARRQWEDAVRALSEMSATNRHAELAALDSDARAQLHAAAVPINADQLVAEIDALEVAVPTRPDAAAQANAPAPLDVAAMSMPGKLSKAWEYAKPRLAPDAMAQLEGLFSERSLAMMGAFAVLYVAAQWTPAGWVADGIALATLTVSTFFLGMTVIHVAANFGRYLAAVNATSLADLRVAGEALSAAITEGGVALATALLTKAVGGVAGRTGGGGGGSPYEGPPPTGYVDALTDAGLVRMPVAAAQAVPKTPSALRQLASFAVMTPPPTSGGGGASPAGGSAQGAGTPSPPSSQQPMGPEIWENISHELDLDPATAEAAPADVAAAVRDAQAAGLVPSGTQPGRIHLEVQPHRAASQVRGVKGLSGRDVQSAHIGPTSFLRDAPGYSRGGADTVLMERATHAAFDQHWKDWAMAQRRGGRTQVSVSELYAVMLDAISQTPKLSQLTKNAMAWRLQLELFRDLGLSPKKEVTLPYPNISPAP